MLDIGVRERENSFICISLQIATIPQEKLTMKKILGMLAALLVVVSGSMFVSADQASAAPQCAAGYVCMWTGRAGGGTKISPTGDFVLDGGATAVAPPSDALNKEKL